MTENIKNTYLTAIAVQSISKTYKLYKSQRDRIKELLHPLKRCYHQKHHALKDVSFEVKKGEVFGIIGQNGSGKSTLLKILASVVSPTSGSFVAHGRITALLELTAGFNPSLTGVENIYFLGAIQGYPKKLLNERIKDILEFAELGEYAYQPVKTYSSGMHVRLAFSQAINIDPDILITDEALSVGDIRFQQKCYRKIREFKEAGKTIIMCTHNLSAVKEFCDRAIWLHKGEIREQGAPNHVTAKYEAFMMTKESVGNAESSKSKAISTAFALDKSRLPEKLQSLQWFDLATCESYVKGNILIRFASIYEANSGKQLHTLLGGEDVVLVVYITSEQSFNNVMLELIFNSALGTSVFKINSNQHKAILQINKKQQNIACLRFKFPHLANGKYTISLTIKTHHADESQQQHLVHDAMILNVYNPDNKYKTNAQFVIPDAEIRIFE